MSAAFAPHRVSLISISCPADKLATPVRDIAVEVPTPATVGSLMRSAAVVDAGQICEKAFGLPYCEPFAVEVASRSSGTIPAAVVVEVNIALKVRLAE